MTWYPSKIATSGTGSLTETELEYLDDITPGTVAANKAIVPTTNKHIDALVVSDGGLALGAGAGTVITAKAAELNLVDDLPASCTLTPAAGAANVCNVAIVAKDAAGVAMTRSVLLLVWLSDASTGIGLTGTSASGTVQAKAGTGADFGALTAKKALIVQTKADGTYTLEITDSAKTGFYVCAAPLRGGAPSVSAQLAAGSYGA